MQRATWDSGVIESMLLYMIEHRRIAMLSLTSWIRPILMWNALIWVHCLDHNNYY